MREPETRSGRVRSVTELEGRTLLSVEGVDGPFELVVPVAPDARAARAAAAGLRRLQWVQLVVDDVSPHARLAGTTRHPHVRVVPLGAGLALARQGLPAYVLGEGI